MNICIDAFDVGFAYDEINWIWIERIW